jgi:4,5-dihydroxyphthalate decarboxylase
MHVLAVQKRIVERYPELPEQLFRLYADAKRWGRRWRRTIPSLVEAWPNHYIAEESEIFKGDPWAYGLEANRHVLDKFFQYCHAQGISGRAIGIEEIFYPSTLKLSES